MISSISNASEHYRNALSVCREIFAAAERKFEEPQGAKDKLAQARQLFLAGDEKRAVTEVTHATTWLNNIARKFLLGAAEYYDGRINKLSYMGLDRDIVERMDARLGEFREVMAFETNGHFTKRLDAYRKLAATVNGAREEQSRREEHRQQMADAETSHKEQERRERRRKQEEADRLRAKELQEAAEAAARIERAKQFDELFS